MRQSKEEVSCVGGHAIDVMSAVKELHRIGSQELSKLLRDSENFTIHYLSEAEIHIKIDVEKLVGFLPLHLTAVLLSSDKDEALFRYLLCGIRLLHSLCDLAPRHAKLEQILLDDVKLSEQLLDLLFYLLIVLGVNRQETQKIGNMSTLRSALLACSLYLLTVCISSQWQDLVLVLVAHPKVDIFMDAAFGAVCEAIRFLEIKLSEYDADAFCATLTAEQMANYLCLQCEASLQFLQTLCQQKVFRERLLRNKELCGKGGVLFLAQAILKLNITHPRLQSSRIVAAVSRLKAKVLSILLSLCEAESISYLDEVASSLRGLDLAKSVALQVLELLKSAFSRDPKLFTTCSDKSYPMGFLQLNAMRLADIFSDDSNFRAYITNNFTKILAAIFSLSHGDFLSNWCSSDIPVREEDATLEYDSFASAGWLLDSSLDMLNHKNYKFALNPISMAPASYAHQRTSLFVKIIANLHCFVPNICEEQERNLFLHRFIDCLKMDPFEALPGFSFSSDSTRAVNVCRNLRSLLSQAESLIPNFLNEEDVQLLRVFFDQLQKAITSAELEENQVEDNGIEESVTWDKFSKLNIHQNNQSAGCCLSSLPKEEHQSHINRDNNLKEGTSENSAFQEGEFYFEGDRDDRGDVLLRQCRKASEGLKEDHGDTQNIETSGSDTNSARARNAIDHIGYSDFSKSSEQIMNEKAEIIPSEEKHRRKRKRTIMNEIQITLIEKALLDEPDMQRNAASIQAWADRLSIHGSDVTSSQLKNWLNNRKARLARTAKDVRATVEVDKCDSPESPGRVAYVVSNTRRDRKSIATNSDSAPVEFVDIAPAGIVECQPGQYVMLVDVLGEEVAKGKVYQVNGNWYGVNLDELETFVIDVDELKAERDMMLPYPSEATGTSFHEAEEKVGVMRVLWDSRRIFTLLSRSR